VGRRHGDKTPSLPCPAGRLVAMAPSHCDVSPLLRASVRLSALLCRSVSCCVSVCACSSWPAIDLAPAAAAAGRDGASPSLPSQACCSQSSVVTLFQRSVCTQHDRATTRRLTTVYTDTRGYSAARRLYSYQSRDSRALSSIIIDREKYTVNN